MTVSYHSVLLGMLMLIKKRKAILKAIFWVLLQGTLVSRESMLVITNSFYSYNFNPF